eukprot:TRINITY_DN1918_c0_g1_i3.p1 TRINITY_DN1918_c0_g1~~TRINITY_DN1918_c0_g1_i3.p1  ORF type:complete len:622 (-),score=45.16 TRINITY_DN1918_c0_g1_i3:153-1799(-)
MTDREKSLYSLSAVQYVSERRAGAVSCEEYALALVKRARYYRCMNQWTYRCYELFDQAVDTAKELDQKAETDGIEAIAPLFGLMIPMKGTAAVVQYPSGAGSGVLSGYTPVKDSDMTTMIREKHGIIFGTSNVPEFAYSYRTANPASGHTRSPYNTKFTVGGSSGGSASIVAAYMCPLAVTEDTGGSTRVPAACNQNFGFDPSRNHYPNAGNQGLSYLNDQLGLHARSIEDIILYDRALGAGEVFHDTASKAIANRVAADINVGAPLRPFVVGKWFEVNSDIRQKYDDAKSALQVEGFCLLDVEWPSRHFDRLGQSENVLVERLFGDVTINGKPFVPNLLCSSLSQLSQFVFEYLDAPVSMKEALADCGNAGSGHRPGQMMSAASSNVDETQFRYMMGPWIKDWVEVYNAYFDETGVDVIIIPSSWAATPDLASLAAGTVPLTPVGGVVGDTVGDDSIVFSGNHILKFLHIPKMVVPTGLTFDGRPTAVQFWGRAAPYDKMFDDVFSAERDVEFLHVVSRLSAAIQKSPRLCRVDADLVRPIFHSEPP